MEDPKPELWFKRKLYGWGWTPVTWEGWLITLGYAGIVGLLALRLSEAASLEDVFIEFVLPATALTLCLAYVTRKHGEAPHWH